MARARWLTVAAVLALVAPAASSVSPQRLPPDDNPAELFGYVFPAEAGAVVRIPDAVRAIQAAAGAALCASARPDLPSPAQR